MCECACTRIYICTFVDLVYMFSSTQTCKIKKKRLHHQNTPNHPVSTQDKKNHETLAAVTERPQYDRGTRLPTLHLLPLSPSPERRPHHGGGRPDPN